MRSKQVLYNTMTWDPETASSVSFVPNYRCVLCCAVLCHAVTSFAFHMQAAIIGLNCLQRHSPYGRVNAQLVSDTHAADLIIGIETVYVCSSTGSTCTRPPPLPLSAPAQ
jgi:hypothetical protein